MLMRWIYCLHIGMASAGIIGNIWMCYGASIIVKGRKERSMQDLLLYKLILMVSLSDIVGAGFMIVYKGILGRIYGDTDIILMEKPSIVFYTYQISVTMVFVTLLLELIFSLQVCVLVKSKRAMIFTIQFILCIVIAFATMRLSLVCFLSGNRKAISMAVQYFDYPVFCFLEVTLALSTIYLYYLSVYAKLLKIDQLLIKRAMCFLLTILICISPTSVLVLIQVSQGFSFPTDNSLMLFAKLLSSSFYLLNCLPYAIFQCKRNYQDKKPFSITILINPSDVVFDVKDTLGRGAIGHVYKGMYRGTAVAIENFLLWQNDEKDKMTSSLIDACLNEVTKMSRLCHVNIVYFMGAFFEGRNGYLVYEFCNWGSVRDNLTYFRRNRSDLPFDWRWKINIANGIAAGLNYLHQVQLFHRKLSSTKIFISDGTTAKVGVYGDTA